MHDPAQARRLRVVPVVHNQAVAFRGGDLQLSLVAREVSGLPWRAACSPQEPVASSQAGTQARISLSAAEAYMDTIATTCAGSSVKTLSRCT